MTAPDRIYDSYADFYKAEYAKVIRRVTPVSFATLLEAEQTAGDWSNGIIPDLVIGRIAIGRRTFSADLGAGRFGGRLETNQTLVIAPHAPTSILCAGRHRLQVVALPFSRLLDVAGEDLRLPGDGDFGALHTGPLANPYFGQMIGAMFDVADPADPAASLFFDSTLVSLAALLMVEAGKQKIKPARQGALAPWQVRRVTEMMLQHDGAAVPLTELAAAVGLSTFHFCRGFKQSTGMPPHRYQTMLRLDRAKDLLSNTQLSIIEVALSVGYHTPQGLARLFRRELGFSPSEWRRHRAR